MTETRTYRRYLVSKIILGLAGFFLTFITAHAVQVIEGPTLTMDPNSQTPLAGVVELVTDEPVRARLNITDGLDNWTVNFDEPAQVHYLPVLGLKPDRTYTVDIHLLPGGSIGSLFATTAPLPADFPALVTSVSNPDLMEPGYTLLDCMRRDTDDPRPNFSAIVDQAGEVVWYSTVRCPTAGRVLANGNIFYRRNAEAVEMDLLGNEKSVPLDVPGITLHHDLLRTPHGTYLSLSQETVDVLEFPTSDTDPSAPAAPATLRDDLVVEFLPDGTLRRVWAHLEMLDPMRIGYDSLRTTNNGLDWTHSNAVNYRLEDDSIIVSVRHQDAVFKFSRETGEMNWILGPHDNWSQDYLQYLLTPVGSPFRWQFHQHAPMWTDTGTILLFDNGNKRASPFDGNTPAAPPESFSRGVEFEIDEGAMEVRQVWEYGENITDQIFSSFISDADSQDTTGNRLMTFGGTDHVGGVSGVDLGLGTVHARIVETTNDLVPLEVFSMIAYDPAGGRIAMYRSARIPSLYPQNYIKAPNGVGNSLRVVWNLDTGFPELTWSTSPVDSEHDPAEYYLVYVSATPDAGFTMLDSTAYTNLVTDTTAGSVTFFKIVAANVTGTSGDEPSP